MATRSLAREEKYALPLAVGFHVLLVVALLWKPVGDAIVLPPERVAVTLTEDVGLTSTAPDPVPDAAPPAAMVEPQFDPVVEPVRDQPVVRPDTRQPTKRSEPRRERPTKSPPQKPAETKSNIDSDFLGGRGVNDRSESTGTPANEIGSRVRNSLAAAVSRQIKPHWSAPQGADAEQLVTVLAWDMNRDGSLRGNPRVVRQDGVTDANRAQAGRHAEQAIRAVRLAAPFNLPQEYYDAWKRVSDFRFDRKL